MAKWELAREMTLPASRLESEGKSLVGTQETVAETVDHTGKVVGRWIVTWGENGQGVCHEAGKVISSVVTFSFNTIGTNLHVQTFQCARGAAMIYNTMLHTRCSYS